MTKTLPTAPRVTAVWTPRDGEPASGVSLHATTDDGRVLFDGPMTAGQAAFDAVPGTIHLRRALADKSGSLTGRQDTALDVPDFAAAPV